MSANIILNNIKLLIVNVHIARDNRIKSKNCRVEFDIASALQFLKDEIGTDNVRSRYAKELVEWLNKKNIPHIIIGGDFNTIPQSRTIKIMETMLQDALCPSFSCFQGTYTRLNAPFPLRIDYLFHTKSLKVIEANIIKRSPGDHYPVMAKFTLPINQP